MSKKKNSKKLKKAAKAKLAKLDKKLLSASDALLTISVETGKRWNKLFKKSITVAEPIRGKQVDMFFDTTDAVLDQVEEGAERFKKLLGIEENIGDIIQKKLNKNKVVKQLTENASKLVSVVSDSGLKDSIEKGAVKIKMEITDRFSSTSDKKSKKKSSKKSSKKKAGKKKSSASKSKVSTVKKSKPTAKKKTKTALAKATTTGAKRGPKPKATATVKKTTTGAKRGPKPKTKTTVAVKKTTTGAKRGPKPKTAAKKVVAKKTTTGAKRGPKPKTTAAVKKTTTGAKRGPKPKSTAKKLVAKKTIAGAKRGPKPKPGKPGYDDLKKVMGVGAKMQTILNSKGVKTYNDLKRISVGDLQAIINGAGGYYQSYKASMWKSEAALAAAGKFDEMKSGRR